MNIEIMVVEDHEIVRDGLCILIKEQPDMEIVGVAGDGRTAVELVKKVQPDVVIMDIKMLDLNGIEATRQITRKFPDVKVLALSGYSEKQFVAKMFESGASGYLLKNCTLEELVFAIHSIVANKIYLTPDIAHMVFQKSLNRSPNTMGLELSTLTSREREVLQLISEDKRTKDIAVRLNISPRTIEVHRHNIMTKLGIHTVAGLTKFAIREGITTP